MTFRIPSQDRRVSQTNSSDVNGNIYATRNIDFDEEGYIKLSSASLSLYSEDDDVDFDNLQSMFHGSNVYILGGDLFRDASFDFSSTITNVSVTDTNAPTPGPEEDGVYFNDTEVVSDGSTVEYNVSGTWTAISGTQAPVTGEPSVMEVFPSQNSLLFATGNKVNRINTSWTVAQTLTLPTDYLVTSIAVNGNYAYIGTRHQENGEAMMFLWTGVNTTNDGAFGVGTYQINSVKKYGSSVALVTSLGQLLQFNGSGFTELAALPVYFTRSDWSDASNDYGGLTNRGMVVDGDLILLSINPEIQAEGKNYLPNMLGGVWCYDPKIGLYHKYSPTNSYFVSDTGVDIADINTSTDVITVTGMTVPPTGSPFYYSAGGTTIGGLVSQTWFYTIKVTDTTFKVALTKEDADNDNAISLTAATNFNAFSFLVSSDYGANTQGDRSSLLVLNNDEYEQRQFGRTVFSSEIIDNTGVEKWRLNILCPRRENLGYFVTPKMFASNTQDNFNSITLRFLPLKYGDEITVKYKNTEKEGFPVLPPSANSSTNLVTWTSSTTFTTTATPDRGYYDLSNLEEGDEVEIIGGAASGFIASVASVTQSGYQYTVTIDQASPFYVSGDKSIVKFDNWTTLETIDHTYDDVQKTIAADAASGWVQFKIVLKGTNVKVFDNIIDNKAYSRAR